MAKPRVAWGAFLRRHAASTLPLWLGIYVAGLVLCFISETNVRPFLRPFFGGLLLVAALAHVIATLSVMLWVQNRRPAYRTKELLDQRTVLVTVLSLHYIIVFTAVTSRLLRSTHPLQWPEWLFVLAITIATGTLFLLSWNRNLSVGSRIAWTASVVPLAGLLAFMPTSLNLVLLLTSVVVVLYILPYILSKTADRTRSHVLRTFVLLGIPLALFGAASLHTMHAESPWRFGPRCNGPRHESGPNILLVVLDTVKASHLATYGYFRNTMPHLHEWSKRPEVLVFTRAYAEANWTLPSHGSLFTGLYPSRHGAYSRLSEENPWATALDPRHVTLSDRFQESGYQTSAVVGRDRLSFSAASLSQGFQYCDARGPLRAYKPLVHLIAGNVHKLLGRRLSQYLYVGQAFDRRAEAKTNSLLREIESFEGCPFFLFGNYLDAHGPYEAPEPYRYRWSGLSPRFAAGDMQLPIELALAIRRGEERVTDEMKSHITALYDAELTYLDAHLDRLLAYLDSDKRLYENTLVVITSDHGEGLGEHDILGHFGPSYNLYNDQIHIPLFVKFPSRYAHSGEIQPNRLVQLVDIFATVLDAAGLDLPENMDGIPLHLPRKTAYSECLSVSSGKLSSETAIFEGNLKYYVTHQSELLFDLDEDPRESQNLVSERQTDVDHFRALYRVHRRQAQLRFPDTAPRILSEEELMKLRALGYVQ